MPITCVIWGMQVTLDLPNLPWTVMKCFPAMQAQPHSPASAYMQLIRVFVVLLGCIGVQDDAGMHASIAGRIMQGVVVPNARRKVPNVRACLKCCAGNVISCM